MTERLTVGSLFSGIGGLDLGLERAGMQVIWQSEIEPYCCRILKKHWPEVVNHGNIKQIDWNNIEKPDIICGGYPCQPFSTAGKRRGEQDERHLWPWVRECISELRPRYAILENVRGHLSMGGTTVIGELASIGYDTEWRVVSAASVGANHRRDRVFIVAYPDDTRGRAPRGRTDGDGQTQEQERRDITQFRAGRQSADMADPDGIGLEGQRAQQSASRTSRSSQDEDGSVAYTNSRRQQEREPEGQPVLGLSSTGQSVPDMADSEVGVDVRRDWERANYRGEVFGGDNYRGGASFDEVWKWWETEPGMGRVANGIPSRVDRLRGLGNAVVPQVAEVIGRLVVNHHERNNK